MYLKGLLRWVVDEGKDKKGLAVDPKEWTLVSQELHVPQQSNGVDCGVFTTMCADFISDDLPLQYSQAQMLMFREKIGTDIMRGHLLYPGITLRMNEKSNKSRKPAFLYS
jgi:Ulp1 family protease